jgi:TatD DNase family protein
VAALIDTHAHLSSRQFQEDLEQVLERARSAGVGMIINVGLDEGDSAAVVAQSERYPQVWAAVGIHPHFAAAVTSDFKKKLASLAENRRVLAIGETGLDFYRDLSPRHLQEKVFREQLALAASLNKPVIIHSRAAYPRTLQILKESELPRSGVAHCFSGGPADLDAFLELGFYISIAGPVTYPRSHELRSLLKKIPAKRLLLETDAPYLAPLPHRGKRNEPAYIKHTYQRTALALELEPAQLARQVQANAARLFLA